VLDLQEGVEAVGRHAGTRLSAPRNTRGAEVTVLTCSFCSKRIFTSKENYRTTNVKVNGVWTQLCHHTDCDPFTVKTTVTRK
jgi:hypothetical protein